MAIIDMFWATASTVTVVIAGRRIDASRAARIEGNVVVAPLNPFVRDIAERIDGDGSGLRFTLRRRDRSVSFAIGHPEALADDVTQRLPAVPSLRDGEPYVPLAAIARDLGAVVSYDAPSRTLSVMLVATPVATMTPFVRYVPPPGPLPTFTDKPTPAPRATVTGIPRPRRTPILVTPD